MVLGGWGSVRLKGWSWEVGVSQTERMAVCLHFTRRNSAAPKEKGEVDLIQPGSDLDPNPLVGTSNF